MNFAAPRVLVAEDDEALLELLTDELENYGYEVDAVISGDALVRVLEDQRRGSGARYDLIVTDICMPGANGIEGLKVLRSFDKDTPVIVISGHLSLDDTASALAHGAAAILDKPFELTQLRQEASSVIGIPATLR